MWPDSKLDSKLASIACSEMGAVALQIPQALHQGSPRQLGLPQYSNSCQSLVMSLPSLLKNLSIV